MLLLTICPQKELTPNKWTRYILFKIFDRHSFFPLLKTAFVGFN